LTLPQVSFYAANLIGAEKRLITFAVICKKALGKTRVLQSKPIIPKKSVLVLIPNGQKEQVN